MDQDGLWSIAHVWAIPAMHGMRMDRIGHPVAGGGAMETDLVTHVHRVLLLAVTACSLAVVPGARAASARSASSPAAAPGAASAPPTVSVPQPAADSGAGGGARRTAARTGGVAAPTKAHGPRGPASHRYVGARAPAGTAIALAFVAAFLLSSSAGPYVRVPPLRRRAALSAGARLEPPGRR
jgi:hypothetical protein